MIDHDAVIQIESSGNPNDENKQSGARGLYQITYKCLADWNEQHPNILYSMDDLFVPSVNKLIGRWYLDVRIPEYFIKWNIKINDGNLLAAFNWGPTAFHEWYDNGQDMVKLPSETVRYIWKYKRELERKEIENG